MQAYSLHVTVAIPACQPEFSASPCLYDRFIFEAMQHSTNPKNLPKGSFPSTTGKAGLPAKAMPALALWTPEAKARGAPPPPGSTPCTWVAGAVPDPPPPLAWGVVSPPPPPTPPADYPVKAPPGYMSAAPPTAYPGKAPPASPPPTSKPIDGPVTARDFKVKFCTDEDWVVMAAEEASSSASAACPKAEEEKRRLRQQAKRARRQVAKREAEEAVALKAATRGISAMKVDGEQAATPACDPFRGSSAGGSCAGGAGSSKDDVVMGGGSETASTAIPASDPFRGSSAGGSCAGGAGAGGSADSDSDAEGDGNGNGNGDRRMKGKLECAECGVDCHNRSDFMLVEGGPGGCGASWQGKMWGHCQTCSGLSAKVFKKKAKKTWADRANALRQRVQHVRCADFDTIGELLLKQLPGASAMLVRYLANSRIRCATIAFAVAVVNESKELLEIHDRLTKQYLQDCKDAAEDPRNACTVEGHFFSSTEAQYLTNVADGITISFGCRFRNCLWFGYNHKWQKQRGSEHLRCPCCGLLYQPEAAGRDRAPFSFVLSMPDV